MELCPGIAHDVNACEVHHVFNTARQVAVDSQFLSPSVRRAEDQPAFCAAVRTRGSRPRSFLKATSGSGSATYSDSVQAASCRDGGRYHLDITEKKTGKLRRFTVPLVIAQYIENYCLRNSIRRDDLIFPVSIRAVQKQLAIVCDYLGYTGVGTHSFRKWYATELYRDNGYDIALVQRLLQHSSAAITQRYIGIESRRIEEAIEGHIRLL